MTARQSSTESDAYTRNAEVASIEDGLKATRRFIAAAILAAESAATNLNTDSDDLLPHQIQSEAWAFQVGRADGLRMAQRALSADPSTDVEIPRVEEVTA